MLHMINKGQRGDVAVLLAASKLIESGISILQPISDSLRYDLVATTGEKFFRLQVKRAYSYKDTKRFVVELRTITVKPDGNKIHKYNANEIDFIIGVVVSTGDIYCLPIQDILGKTAIHLDPLKASSKPPTNRKIDPELYRNIIVLDGTEYKLGRS